jgi:hypothetical protein
MARPKGLPADFAGPAYDSAHGYTPETGMALRDGARQYQVDLTAYRAAAMARKFCLTCHHWSQLHPDHGRCQGRTLVPCGCPEFNDPEPGRPDQVYTRDQIDRMWRWRWEEIRNRVYLLVDGRYGLIDPWTDPEKYFAGFQAPHKPRELSQGPEGPSGPQAGTGAP